MKFGTLICSLAVACGGMLVAWNWTGCGEDPGSHQARTASRPASATGPTTAEVLARETPPLPRDVEAIPPLGAAVVQKDPKSGEVWQVYPNGLAYRDLASSIGPVPRLGQTVKVQYVGTIPETGTVFDQSKPDEPFSFVLGTRNIIQGWNMAVSTMHVGAKRKIRVPADLAYGQRGSPPKIGPGQTLIFEITLLGVTGPAAETSSRPAPALPAGSQIGPPLPPAGTEPATRGS
jgi:FKBP-type peptidyl-prolyl cis-trans isomerase FkpA